MGKRKLNILITGGNGFLGSALAHRLVINHNIYILEKSDNNVSRLEDINDKLCVYKSDRKSLNLIFGKHKIDIIIHTATLYGKIDTKISDIVVSNVLMPLQILDFAVKYNVKAFINTDTFFNQPNSKYKYLGNYTLSKKHLNDWLEFFSGKLSIFNMKLQHLYGPGDNDDKFVIQMVKSINSGISRIELTPGEQIRDFIYIDDVVDAYQIIINNYHNFDCAFHHFDVGTGNGKTLKEFVTTIKEVSNSGTILDFGAISYRHNEIMESVADIKPLKKLGWNPKVDVRNGIKNIIQNI